MIVTEAGGRAIVVSVRDATVCDARDLTSLVRTSAAYEGKYRPMVALQRIDAAYISSNPTRVAEADGNVEGFYSLLLPGRGGESEAELDFMFVRDRRRGSGVGRVLMDDLRQRASSLGVHRVHIVSHPPAVDFYRAMGARSVGVLEPAGRVTWSRPVLVLDLTHS